MVKLRTMQSRWPEICPVTFALPAKLRQLPTLEKPVQHLTLISELGWMSSFLPGWKPNQRATALNIVDHATSYQLVVPFFETETSTVLRKLCLER